MVAISHASKTSDARLGPVTSKKISVSGTEEVDTHQALHVSTINVHLERRHSKQFLIASH